MLLLRAVFCSLLLCAALAPQTHARDLQTVLQQTKAAAGGATNDNVKAIRLTFRLRQSGLEGTGTTLTDLVTGRTVTRFRLGLMSGAEGFDGHRAWFQDTAGIVTVPDGGDRRAQTVSEQYRNVRAYWYPDRAAPARVSLRIQLFRSRIKEALEVAPKDGLPFELWFDAQTKMLDRVIEVGANETRTTVYEDYRPISGLLIPHSIRSSNAAAAFGSVRLVTKVEINPRLTGAEFDIPPPPRADFAIAGQDGVTVLPFELTNNHIYVDVKLNGKPFPLLVDTGAANVITPTAARRLGLNPVGDARVLGTGDTSAAAAFVRIQRVSAGHLSLRDQLFAVVPLEGLADVEGRPFFGMIGYELFKRLIVTIDYDARKLTLRSVERAPAGAGTAVPFVFNGTVPEIEGDIDGIPASFNVDTGSRTSLGLNSPFVLRHGLRGRFRPSIETVTSWGLGGPSFGTVARVNRVRLGPIQLSSVVVDMSRQTQGVLSHASPAGSVGSGLLKRFVVTFDYPRQLIYMAPTANTAKPDSYDRSGLWINRSLRGFRIVSIAPQSPAEEAGLHENDIIVAVDGTPASVISLSALRDRLRDAQLGTAIRLSVQSTGAAREIVLRLRNLI